MSTISMERVCPSDFIVVGFSDGERVNVVVRAVCIAITASVISSWCNRRIIRRLLLFFVHWLRLALLLLPSVRSMGNCPLLFQIRYVKSKRLIRSIRVLLFVYASGPELLNRRIYRLWIHKVCQTEYQLKFKLLCWRQDMPERRSPAAWIKIKHTKDI